MIQDIAPSIFHNEYVVREPSPNDYVFIFKNRQILVRDDGDSITCPKVSDIGNDKFQFLFTINNNTTTFILVMKISLRKASTIQI